MLKRNKEVWHKLNPVPQATDVSVASERAFKVNADGTIHGGQCWRRGARTAGEWRQFTLKAEFHTVEAFRALLERQGFKPGEAPRGTLPPTLKTVMQWDWDRGGCEATDGCWVEPDGRCEHNAPAWSLVYGTV